MPEGHCANCDTAFVESARFCSHCGQGTGTKRISFGDVTRDLVQANSSFERGPLAFSCALLTRPGNVAREYVEGKRRRHYGPFATLAVIVGITALAFNLSGYRVLFHDGLPPAPTSLLEHHFNLVLLAQLPLLGGACAVLFRGAALTLPEHMVLVAYALCVRAAFLALVGAVAWLASTHAPGLGYVYAYWVAWYVYFGWAASQFYAGPRLHTWIRGAAAAALARVATSAALWAGSAAYESLVRS
jgi:uncharacterized protein DUF3667